MNLDHIVFLRCYSTIIGYVKRFVKEKIPRKKIKCKCNRVCLENKGGSIKRREPSAFIDYISNSKNNAPSKYKSQMQNANKGREGNRTPQWYWPITACCVRLKHPPYRVFHKRESIRPLSYSAIYESPFGILSKFNSLYHNITTLSTVFSNLIIASS